MIKRLSKSKRNKQGAILVLVVLILALAMIFIASAMMLTQATRSRLYENTMSSQARLTVSAAAETFLEALQTQEITDKQMDAMLAECSTRQTDNSKKIKMVINGVPGMSTASDNCTYLDLYYPDTTDTTTVYADFTTIIGDQTENVRVILVVEDPHSTNNGRFKNQIDIAGDVGAEQLRFTEGVGMTSAAKRAEGITDNTILLRGSGYEQASSNVVYSTMVFAEGAVATFGGSNVFNGDMVLLDGAYMSTYSSASQYNGDIYFVGASGSSDPGFKFKYDAGWDGFASGTNFYFKNRTVQAYDKDLSNDQNAKIKGMITSETVPHNCYFVGVSGNVSASWGNGSGVEQPYTVTNAGSALPTDAANYMAVYSQYNYSTDNQFPTDTRSEVLNEINVDGQKIKLSSAQTFDYDNYDTAGNLYAAGTEIPADTELIAHPITAEYPAYRKIMDGTNKVIDPDKTFDIGSLDTYDSDGDRIIDLANGGAYHFTAGTTMSNNNNVEPYVFAINGAKQNVLYFGSGEFNFNCCCFALYNVSDTMYPVIIIMEDGAEFVLAGDSSYQVGTEALCSAGFLSLDRGYTSAAGIGGYIHDHGTTYEDTDWEQENGDTCTYSSKYDGNVRPNMYIYGVKNNKITFGNDNIVEAYVGLYDGSSSASGFYSASNGAHCRLYGRLEGRRITNGTADTYSMPYCPAPANTDSQPDERVAVTKYKVSNIIYYYGTLDSEPEPEGEGA